MFPCKSFSRIGLAPSAHPDFSARSSPLFQDATRFNDFETCERPSRLGRCRRGPNSLNGCARHGLRSVLASAGSVRGSMNTQLPLDTKLTQPGIRLHWPADAEFAHASLERGALHTKQSGGSLGAGDAPLRLLERTQDVLALSFFESGNRGA